MFKSSTSSSSKNTEKSTGDRSSYLLNSPQQIIPLIKQIHKSHTLLNASPKEDERTFSTAILGIYSEHGFIVLDELSPKSGHKKFLEQKEIIVRCRLDGVDVGFKAALIEAREKDGVAFYKVSIPRVVRYMQRRQDHRVPTRGTTIPFLAYHSEGGNRPIRGDLFDLSRKGLGVTLHDSMKLNVGDILSTCSMTLPGEGKIAFTLEVRYFSRSKNSKTARMGGRYQKIDSASTQKISRIISLLEREEAKRLSRL